MVLTFTYAGEDYQALPTKEQAALAAELYRSSDTTGVLTQSAVQAIMPHLHKSYQRVMWLYEAFCLSGIKVEALNQ